jgi:hypothetical protein
VAPANSDADRRDVRKLGNHRLQRKRRSAVKRTIAVGGAAACIGVIAELDLPIADALTIVFNGVGVHGAGNTTQINILEGNVFDPQLTVQGDNVSSNSTAENVVTGNGESHHWAEELLSMQFVVGASVGNGNTTLINILSYNVINPQVSLQGGNTSNNSTSSNVVLGNGNQSELTSAGGMGTSVLGGMLGNGNTTLIALFSGNIFNPQISLFGSNMSGNTTTTNVSALNGNFSEASVTSGGLFGTTLFGGVIGNGNTTQIASVAGNIVNPQLSLFGSNTSHNWAATNVSVQNGNFSQTSTTSGGFLGAMLFGGVTGNGNTNQYASFVSNIGNSQLTYLGKNESENDATTNISADNGNFSENEVGSTGSLGDNIVLGGVNGNGNSQQTAITSSNVINNQLRLGNQIWLPGMPLPTSEQHNGAQLRESLVARPGATGFTDSRRPLRTVVSRVEDAVDRRTVGAINRTRGISSSQTSGDGSTDSSETDNQSE